MMYCGQTVGWIMMPLRVEVALGPGDIVLDGDPAPPPKEGKGHSSFAVSAIFLLLVSAYVPVGRRLPPFWDDRYK